MVSKPMTSPVQEQKRCLLFLVAPSPMTIVSGLGFDRSFALSLLAASVGLRLIGLPYVSAHAPYGRARNTVGHVVVMTTSEDVLPECTTMPLTVSKIELFEHQYDIVRSLNII